MIHKKVKTIPAAGDFGSRINGLQNRAEKLGYFVNCDQDVSLQLFAPVHGFDTVESISNFLDGVECSRARRRS